MEKHGALGPFSDEEMVTIREMVKGYEWRRRLREQIDLWVRWAVLIVPVVVAVYMAWQTRGGK
jgi:hypothetical protein